MASIFSSYYCSSSVMKITLLLQMLSSSLSSASSSSLLKETESSKVDISWPCRYSNLTLSTTFHCISQCDQTIGQSLSDCYRIYQCAKPDFDSGHTNIIAYARFVNRMNETGWAELDLVTNPLHDDVNQAYFAGILEASLTKRMIKSYATNIQNGDECKTFSTIIKKSLNSTIERALKLANNNDPYWTQVLLTLYQLSGMEEGYRLAEMAHIKQFTTRPNLEINPCGLILLQLYTEFDDLRRIVNAQPTEHPESRCSALVKILPDMDDIVISHVTWSNFKTLLRIMKRYTLNYRSSQAKSISMSSYPGALFSTDDYYITSQHLVVLETTINNHNMKLYNEVKVEEMIFEFIRNIIANRLARSGQEWAEIFSKHNSGTYNNQFMILDYKRFNPNTEKKLIEPGLLTIIEQMPTIVKWQDITKKLLEKSYWPSYNVPYFDEIWNIANYESMYKLYGDQYTYDKCARALIFARDHVKVSNMSTLYHLMRYNNFKHDPLSRCNCTPPYTADRAISSRNDLNDPNGKYPMYEYSFRPSAGLDAKMTNYQMAKSLQMVAVSGPTNEYLPTFSWRTTKFQNLAHVDQPEEFNFKPIVVNWDNNKQFNEFKFNF